MFIEVCRNFAFFIAITLLSACSQVKVSKDSDLDANISINYEKFTLDNGLTVVLHEDHSDPLVHVDVTYHVGSARESIGRSGFAHFFEHMMFQGSKHVADEQHFKIVTQAGGDLSGTTNSDRTNYYQTVPSNQLERMLWLESDRMGFLLEAVNQEKFEIQRETVKNERGQRVDNQPYGLRSEKIAQALYPERHPYSWPTIGYVEDLDRVDVNDLKQFFLRWYGPNNAVLTIGGDFNKAQLKTWITKYFAPIPRGPEVVDSEVVEVNLTETRYITLEDSVHLPLIQKTLPTVKARHPDEAALDVLADILGGGKTSLLYKNVVKTGDAVQAVVSHPCKELACEFNIIALANPEQTANLQQLEHKINTTLEEFEKRGVLDDDLQRTKANIESSTVFNLQSVAGKVSILAANETFYGNPDLVVQDLDRYRSVTAADVLRVYQKYIKNKAGVVLSIVPHDSIALAAAPQNYVPPPRSVGQDTEVVNTRTSVSTFDRRVMPPSGPPPLVKIPELWQSLINEKIGVMGIEAYDTPTVNLSFAFEGGVLLDPIDKAGLASVTASLMNQSTHNFSNESIANELEKLGSNISFIAGGRYTIMSVSSLKKNLDKTLELVQEKLLQPAFLEDEFNRTMTRLIQSKNQQKNDSGSMLSKAQGLILFGNNNRVSLPDDGTLSTLKNITIDDVREFYRRYYTSAMANVVVVGAVSQQDILPKLGFLNNLNDNEYTIPKYAPFPEYAGQSIFLVDKPGAVQSSLRLVKRAMPYDATGDYFKAQLMNFPLGAAFNSRINLNLREDKSITYGAGSSFVGGKSLGWFEVGGDIIAQSTGLAISEILEELNTYKREGILAEELIFMKNAYTQSDALSYETPTSKAGFLRRLSAYNLSTDYKAQQLDIINGMTIEKINQTVLQHLHPTELQIIVIGDADVIEKQLKAFDLPIKKLDLTE